MDTKSGTAAESPNGTELLGLIEAQSAAARDLLQVLEDEYQFLRQQDLSGLEQFAQRKLDGLSRLNALGIECDTLLQAHGLTPGNDGMTTLIERQQGLSVETLQASWTQTLDLIRRCEKQNSVNGTVIELRYRATDQILGALTGQPESSRTYDPKGNTHSPRPGYTLAKA